jgi:hypothetical protein
MPQPIEAMPAPDEYLEPQRPATLAMPESVQPDHVSETTIGATPHPDALPNVEMAEEGLGHLPPTAMVERTPVAASPAPQSVIRMPESIRAAPSRIVSSRNAVQQPAIQDSPSIRQPAMNDTIQMPGSIRAMPNATQAPAPAQPLLFQPPAVQPEPEPWSAAAGSAPLPTLAAPMQFPNSIRVGKPQAAIQRIPRLADSGARRMTLPTRAASSASPPPYGQLQMPASMTGGAPRVMAAAIPVARRAENRPVVEAAPISHQVPAQTMQFPASIVTQAR